MMRMNKLLAFGITSLFGVLFGLFYTPLLFTYLPGRASLLAWWFAALVVLIDLILCAALFLILAEKQITPILDGLLFIITLFLTYQTWTELQRGPNYPSLWMSLFLTAITALLLVFSISATKVKQVSNYPALALTVTFAIPFGFIVLFPIGLWLRALPLIAGASALLLVSFFFVPAFVVDFYVSKALYFLLIRKPISSGDIMWLPLILLGLVFSMFLSLQNWSPRSGLATLLCTVVVSLIFFLSVFQKKLLHPKS